MKPKDICIMKVVEGSLTNPAVVMSLPHKRYAIFDDPNWKALLEVEVPYGKLADIQQIMVKHYHGPEPWYMDGVCKNNPNIVICAFGADDGEGGRVFVFKRNDTKAFDKVVEYAISKGIPKEIMDFLE